MHAIACNCFAATERRIKWFCLFHFGNCAASWTSVHARILKSRSDDGNAWGTSRRVTDMLPRTALILNYHRGRFRAFYLIFFFFSFSSCSRTCEARITWGAPPASICWFTPIVRLPIYFVEKERYIKRASGPGVASLPSLEFFKKECFFISRIGRRRRAGPVGTRGIVGASHKHLFERPTIHTPILRQNAAYFYPYFPKVFVCSFNCFIL